MMKNKSFWLLIITSLLFSLGVSAQEKETVKRLESPYFVFPRLGDKHIDLSSDWILTASDAPVESIAALAGKESITVESPTSVQMAYYKAGKLPEPYKNLNSELYHPLEQKVHYYRKSFPTPKFEASDNVILTFDGIDYASKVWLNGTLLGEHEGMFGGPTVKINEFLKTDGSRNDLVVEVKSANYQLPDYQGRVPGRFVRTWFFSNASVTPFFHMGMWNGVRIDILPYYHLERPFMATRSIANGKAVVDFTTEIFSGKNSKDYILHRWNNHQASSAARTSVFADDDVKVIVHLFDGNKEAYTKTFTPKVVKGRCWMEESFELDNPKLWWPNGMGSPDYYQTEVELVVNGVSTDKIGFDFGVRTIEHVRSAGVRVEDRWNNWQFVVNGKKIFVKGVNWLPLDAISDLPYEKYEWPLRAARDMGVQVLRIWGAGYMETEAFYDICKKYGIMVWQDFTMANSDTPEWPQDVWEAQVCQNIFRLRNQPALAVWCGGNEFNPYCYGNTTSIGITERNLKEFDPTRPFWRTTPDGGSDHLYPDFDPNHYKDYKLMPYVAETGIHTMSSARDNRKIVAAEEFKGLGVMFEETFRSTHPDFVHHFAEYWPSRVPRMLSRASHISDVSDPLYEDMVEASQVGAGEFYQIMSEGLQSNYPVTTGLMPWVLKRPWPVVAAIQIMDYYGQPTAPYYFLKRTYEKTHVLVDLPRMLYAPGDIIPIKVNVLNGVNTKAISGKVSLRILDDKFKEIKSYEQAISVPAGTSVAKTELGEFSIPAEYRSRFFFLVARLLGSDGSEISRSIYWPRTIPQMEDPEYYKKYLESAPEWPTLDKGPWLKPTVAKSKTTLKVSEVTSPTAGTYCLTVINKGKNPSPMTIIDVDDRIFTCSDNFFWLEPGESKDITINTTKGSLGENGPFKIIVNSWNAKSTILPIK